MAAEVDWTGIFLAFSTVRMGNTTVGDGKRQIFDLLHLVDPIGSLVQNYMDRNIDVNDARRAFTSLLVSFHYEGNMQEAMAVFERRVLTRPIRRIHINTITTAVRREIGWLDHITKLLLDVEERRITVHTAFNSLVDVLGQVFGISGI